MFEKNQSRWYAVYTASRAEKKVKERLDQQGIVNYLPLRVVIRKWSDRSKKVEIPLINGYIFVYVNLLQMQKVLTTFGVVSFLKEFGIPAPIPDKQIKALRFMNDNAEEEVEISTVDLPVGSYVRVLLGKLAGLEGELVEVRGKHRIMVRLEHLGCALTTVPLSCVEPYRRVASGT